MAADAAIPHTKMTMKLLSLFHDRRGDVSTDTLIEILIAVTVCVILLSTVTAALPDLGASLSSRMQTLFSQ